MNPRKSNSSEGRWVVNYNFTDWDYKQRQYHGNADMYFWHKVDAINWINSFN